MKPRDPASMFAGGDEGEAAAAAAAVEWSIRWRGSVLEEEEYRKEGMRELRPEEESEKAIRSEKRTERRFGR